MRLGNKANTCGYRFRVGSVRFEMESGCWRGIVLWWWWWWLWVFFSFLLLLAWGNMFCICFPLSRLLRRGVCSLYDDAREEWDLCWSRRTNSFFVSSRFEFLVFLSSLFCLSLSLSLSLSLFAFHSRARFVHCIHVLVLTLWICVLSRSFLDFLPFSSLLLSLSRLIIFPSSYISPPSRSFLAFFS